MRSRTPDDHLAEVLKALQPALEMAGVRLGPFLAGGAQGDVYEAGPGRVAKVMYADHGPGEEWRVAGVLTAREAAGDPLPKGLVRTFHLLTLDVPKPLAFYLKEAKVHVLVRERLYEDDSRARAALFTLVGALNYLRDGARYGHSFAIPHDLYAWAHGNAALKVVGLGMGWLFRQGLLPEDKAIQKRMEQDGAQILDAALWLFGRGYVLNDYFDLNEVKAENVGFRKRGHAVALDLGYLRVR